MLSSEVFKHIGTQTGDSVDLVVEQLSSFNWNGFEKLFSGCEQCRECWCLNHRVAPSAVVTGESAKAKMKSMVAERKVGGLLGFVGGECVAWISVDPIETQVGHDFVIERSATCSAGAWAIHCVYIAPTYRGKGLSRTLIEKAIEFAKGHGATSVLAFPIPNATRAKFPKDDAEFSGRHSTFKKAGFAEGETLNAFYQVMELSLEGS